MQTLLNRGTHLIVVQFSNGCFGQLVKCVCLVSCYVAIADNSGEEFRDVKQDLVR